jgi:molybdopterin-containing oxidoreductase family iron-sulfur binding subunit
MTTNKTKIHIELTAADVVKPPPRKPISREQLHMRLAGVQRQQYWRSLEALADTPEFHEFVEREFPKGAAEMLDPVSRRSFLKLMGASFALAGLTSACTHMPREYIAPYTQAPEGLIPGVAKFFASSVTLGGYASGILVESHEFRPTKIEGNPDHPASLGATDLFAQASILNLYDPDRSLFVRERGQQSSWQNFLAALEPALQGQQANGGAGLRVLTETVTSPTLANQIQELIAEFPQAQWHQYEPINRDNSYEGARLAFGEDVDTIYDFTQAQVILSLDADFLSPGPGFLAYARAFTEGRRVSKDNLNMNRLYVVESTPTATGAAADHRLALQSRLVESLSYALAQRLGVGAGPDNSVTFTPEQESWLDAVAQDLQDNAGASLVIAGDRQPPAVHALVHAINNQLTNVGSTVSYVEPVAANPVNQTQSLTELTTAMNAGEVDMLLILGGNPVYTAPADLGFSAGLANVALSAHLSIDVNETSAAATWHIPAAHYLESWSDARAFEGTTSIIQPLIEPLYGGRSAHDLLNAFLGQPQRSGYDTVRAYWQEQDLGPGFEQAWQIALSRGYIANTQAPTVSVTLQDDAVGTASAPDMSGFEVNFRPDPTIWDGSFANNAWLQEIPKSITQLTWDNAVLISPRTAVQIFGLALSDTNNLRPKDLEQLTQVNGRVVALNFAGNSLQAPVWLMPGHPDNSVTLHLGYGRNAVGEVGRDAAGFNAYVLRTFGAPWIGSGLEISATGERQMLVSTQNHWTLDGRDIVRSGTLAQIREDPKAISKEVYQEEYGRDTPGVGEAEGYESIQPSGPPPELQAPNAWGMSINLSACIGCNACLAACQAENNIPVVGKKEIANGREMHWIRIDRYYAGDSLDNPTIYQQPLTCMQCEQAPCEIVCPVAATVHDNEGLNNMTYNRCVGTKYCSNNCPYKVRRFNFFQYSDLNTDTLKLMRNPNVTVRNRGVMEKCTYCVQRISVARIEAKKAAVENGQQSYTIPDGAITTACEAACPTDAIVFGDIRDPNSRVAKWKADPLNYGILEFLNTHPRTSYLARVRNPNPDLEGEA